MAGTIISLPSIGASDWTNFITQQGATDTGYLRVSLTNFSGTAASTIATGSVLECAGSIYTFTDTAITLASGTTSSATAVYYTVIPTAGGTTVSIVMNSVVPVWVDSKQGFYATAASLTRYVGGCYIGTAATYYNKYLYTGENLVYCLQTGETRPIMHKALEIGEWNMDSTIYADVSGTFRCTNFRKITGVIFPDTGIAVYPLDRFYGGTGGTMQGGVDSVSTTAIRLYRLQNGQFDSAGFNATAGTLANRGFVFIEYEA